MLEHTQGKVVRRALRARKLFVMAAAMGLLASAPAVQAEDPIETVLDLLDNEIVEPRNTGGGTSMGPMTYVSATKLPKAFARCEDNLEFTLEWQSEAFVFNTVISGFAGPVSMSGSGGSDGSLNCENYTSGAGVMTIAVEGHPDDNPTESKLDCRDDYPNQDPVAKEKSRSLRGRFTRSFSNTVVILSGRCLVNDYATGPVTFIAVIQAVPGDLSGGEGITRSVETLKTTGTFTLVPA